MENIAIAGFIKRGGFMFKGKAIILSILALGLFGSPSTVAAETTEDIQTPVEMNVNGKFVQMDVYPVIEQSHLLIPIRALSSLGLSYDWNPSAKTATIKNREGDVLQITQDSRVALKNGSPMEMTIPARNKKGRILVPVRFVAESLDYNVQYETIRKMVFVTSADYEFDLDLIEQDDLQAARKAAISLPITADFEPLGFPTRPYHSYTFLKGKADTYFFSDRYTHSIVEIKEGKAVLVAQYVDGGRSTFSHKAGNIERYGDPVMRKFYDPENKPVYFGENPDQTATTLYFEGETQKRFTSPIKVYSDIIQKVPGNQ